MDGTAIFFWLAMAGLLAVALVLRRWHADALACRLADSRRRRAVGPQGRDAGAQPHPWRGVEPDAAFPEGIERASA